MPDGRYHHGDLRAALLTAAGRTLRADGVDAVSLRALARDVGVSHAAPSRHFKDRRALLDALALGGFDRLTELLKVAAVAPGDFAERVAATARTYVDFAVHEAELLDLMFVGKHAPDASAELVAAGLRMGEPVFALIAEGQRSGDVRPGDPERLAMTVVSGLHGFASLTASGMLPGDADLLPDVVAHLMRGLRPDPR